MTVRFSFEVTARDGLARVGAIATPRGPRIASLAICALILATRVPLPGV